MVDPTQPQKVLLKFQGVIDIQLGMSTDSGHLVSFWKTWSRDLAQVIVLFSTDTADSLASLNL